MYTKPVSCGLKPTVKEMDWRLVLVFQFGSHAGCQEVDRCSIRGGNVQANEAELTLAMKPRGNVARKPNWGTSDPKIGHVNVSDKKMFKKKNK